MAVYLPIELLADRLHAAQKLRQYFLLVETGSDDGEAGQITVHNSAYARGLYSAYARGL